MNRVAESQCEWGVNAFGNVLVALPRFHAESLDHARLHGNVLVFHHDWFRRTAVTVPAAVLEHLALQPSVLLVVFEAGGNIHEVDLPVRIMGPSDTLE